MKKLGNPYRFLYLFAFFLGLLLLPSPLASQVNQSEFDDLGPVEFINYEGPHSRIETRAQIRGIGYDLGLAVKGGSARAGAQNRYFVIHSVSNPDGSKMDADIFGLGADVGVDHVRNLRFIIQGYLEAAYEYTERDAALLAEYITVYNAVYRGDTGYFASRYKDPVMENLSQERAGLAIRYDEWPGQTLMLIPMGSGLGGQLSTIDTSAITDSRVIEQLRQEPDMGLDQRREMVELLEREADQASQDAVIAREAIRQEEERVARERQQAQEQERQAQEAQRQAQEAQRQAQEAQRQAQEEQQRIAGERQQPGADQEALDQQEEEAQRREGEAQRREEEAQRQEGEAQRREEEAQRQEGEAQEQLEELDQREEGLEEQRQLAEAQEAFAEQRTEEAQEQRQQIAEDQQSLIDQPSLPAQAGGSILGISLLNNDSVLGRLVLLDNTGRVIRQSSLNTVNSRSVIQISNRVFAIAGIAQGSGAIRILEIDGSTLEMQHQGDDDIAPQSLLWTNGQDLYAVTSSGGSFNLARFNTDLVLQASSSVAVHPFASVFFNGGLVVTQRTDGSAALLDPRDLSER